MRKTEKKLNMKQAAEFGIFRIKADGRRRIFADDLGPRNGLKNLDKKSLIEIKGNKNEPPDWNKVVFSMTNTKSCLVAKGAKQIIGHLHPIINLDLYKKKKGKKIPIPKDSKIEVTVNFKIGKAKKLYEDNKKVVFYFYVEDNKAPGSAIWIPVGTNRYGLNTKAIKPKDSNGNVTKFIINEWPVDDGWVSSGP